jgi:GcrA cell cycle regulator
MATTNSWSAGMIAKLKSLFEKGLSTSEIGKRLGLTKNAVVGKINRLGLNMAGASSSAKTAAKKAKKAAAPVRPSKVVKKPAGVKKSASKKEIAKNRTESRRKTERIIQHSAQLMALRADQCRWPVGDPDSDDFHFCGEKCFTGKPYCFEHCKVAYQFSAPARKK